MEFWNVGRLGLKSGKRSILQKMLYLHFMMMPVRHPFSTFAPENTPLLRENQFNYIRFDSLNPPFHYPRTHDSNIPEFQHSIWGEASNLSFVITSFLFLTRIFSAYRGMPQNHLIPIFTKSI
jgi:hypothetical protein